MEASIGVAPTARPRKRNRSKAEILIELWRVACALSPENLTCDGELRGTALIRKGRRLRAERKALICELGREPLDSELQAE